MYLLLNDLYIYICYNYYIGTSISSSNSSGFSFVTASNSKKVNDSFSFVTEAMRSQK